MNSWEAILTPEFKAPEPPLRALIKAKHGHKPKKVFESDWSCARHPENKTRYKTGRRCILCVAEVNEKNTRKIRHGKLIKYAYLMGESY